MNKLSQLPITIQNLLKDCAKQAGSDSGFVQRKSKLSAEVFVQTLTLGWLANPSASLHQLAQTAAIFGIDISAQALDQRFSPQAASCLKQVLEKAVERVIATAPVAVPLLRRFKTVELIDTTIICLPDELLPVWSGCGGSLGASSSLKIELGLDLLTGAVAGPHLYDGRTHDSKGILHNTNTEAGSLRLTDLAYFKLQSMSELSQQRVYWITRVKAATGIVDQEGKRWKLLDFVRAQNSERIDRQVKLGFNEQIECRLIAVRVSDETASRRRRRLKDKARRNCNKPKKETLELAGWTILVTNVEAEKLSRDEVLVMARLRWQIELIFKLWKSQGQIDEWRSKKPWRILCEVYAKLLGMLIQHWVLVVSGWSCAERSLFKAGKVVQMLALYLATAIESVRGMSKVIKLIEKSIAGRCRVDKRKKAPSSFQLLLSDALA
jgi:hypothetical protein